MNTKFQISALATPATSMGQRPTRKLSAIVASRKSNPTAKYPTYLTANKLTTVSPASAAKTSTYSCDGDAAGGCHSRRVVLFPAARSAGTI